MNVSAATNALVSRPCEICAIFGHIGVDYQLGNAINGVEQMNYAQYNQGMRQNQNFYKKSSKFLWTSSTTWLCKQPESRSEIKFGNFNGKLCHEPI